MPGTRTGPRPQTRSRWGVAEGEAEGAGQLVDDDEGLELGGGAADAAADGAAEGDHPLGTPARFAAIAVRWDPVAATHGVYLNPGSHKRKVGDAVRAYTLVVGEDDCDSVDISGDDPDLAALFCGQLRVIGHPLPSHVAISELGDRVLCVLTWTPPPGFGLSGVATVAMRELVEAHLHRRVAGMRSDDMPGFKSAIVHFFLDESTETPGERAAALGQWSGHAQRVSLERRLVSLAHGEEARRLRARSRITRSESRRERHRHAVVV